MQLKKLKSKNGFVTWPNMALTNMDLKTKNWSHVGEEQTVKRGKERRREEEEEEEKRKKEEPRSKVWN